MGFLVLVPVAIWAAFAQTEISPTDRASFAGTVLAISDETVEVAVGNQLSQLPISKLRSLSFASTAEPDRNRLGTTHLIDGSEFVASALTLADGLAHFTTGIGDVPIPATKLLYLQLQALNEIQNTQWQAIAKSRTEGDALVLVRSQEALEKLEGIVLGITAESVAFDFSGQKIDAPLSKLAGIRFFVSEAKAKEQLEASIVAVVKDKFGGRWMCSKINLPRSRQTAEIVLQCGAKISLPTEHLCSIDFSIGSLLFLAEFEPILRESNKLFELAVKIPGAESLMGVRTRDLRRLEEVSLGPSLEFLGSGKAVYRIPAGFSRLVGEVELRPSGNRFTPCQVAIRMENKPLWGQRLAETGSRVPFDVAVQADGRLEISVAADAVTPVGDVVIWHDIRFVK